MLLSLADLVMTLMHLGAAGLAEGNPIARQVMTYGSPGVLAAWKLATVSLGVGLLYCARRRLIGELAAVFCCLVLVWLMGRWVHYNAHVASLTRELSAVVGNGNPFWVAIEPAP